MKKMILVAFATVLATAGFSQTRYGIQVIGNAGSASFNAEGLEGFKKPMKVGFGAGVVADVNLSDKFNFRPSLNFLQKKAAVEYQTPDLPGKDFSINSTLNYLEMPLNLVYKIPVGASTAYIAAGPSIGYGISGKLKAKGWLASEEGEEPGEIIEVNESVDAFKKEDNEGGGFKRVAVSLNASAGIEFQNGLYINAGYLAGLSNLVKEESYKSKGILLTVGFMLPTRK
jgi:hypothetical protein